MHVSLVQAGLGRVELLSTMCTVTISTILVPIWALLVIQVIKWLSPIGRYDVRLLPFHCTSLVIAFSSILDDYCLSIATSYLDNCDNASLWLLFSVVLCVVNIASVWAAILLANCGLCWATSSRLQRKLGKATASTCFRCTVGKHQQTPHNDSGNWHNCCKFVIDIVSYTNKLYQAFRSPGKVVVPNFNASKVKPPPPQFFCCTDCNHQQMRQSQQIWRLWQIWWLCPVQKFAVHKKHPLERDILPFVANLWFANLWYTHCLLRKPWLQQKSKELKQSQAKLSLEMLSKSCYLYCCKDCATDVAKKNKFYLNATPNYLSTQLIAFSSGATAVTPGFIVYASSRYMRTHQLREKGTHFSWNWRTYVIMDHTPMYPRCLDSVAAFARRHRRLGGPCHHQKNPFTPN